jgi:hypothetical protein
VVKYTKCNVGILMHERQAIVLVLCMLIYSGMLATQSFADTVQCNGLDATHVGTDKRDTIYGSSGGDVIVGLGGNDVIFGKGGKDVICGGSGNDVLYGNSGNDVLIGEGNLDTLDGGEGVDMCDASLDDKRARSCETQFMETNVNIDNLQKQIIDLQSQINEIISRVIKWTDIKEIPEDIADGDQDSLAKIKCNTNQIIVFEDNSWVCKDLPENSDTLSELKCNRDEIAKWNGELWECSMDVAFSASPIFFHHFRLNGGEVYWAGITDVSNGDLEQIPIILPTSGELSRLYAKLAHLEGDIKLLKSGDQYTLTLIKNKVEETELKCIIDEKDDFCISDETKILVEAGDEILLKAQASSEAPFAVIKSSVLLKGL